MLTQTTDGQFCSTKSQTLLKVNMQVKVPKQILHITVLLALNWTPLNMLPKKLSHSENCNRRQKSKKKLNIWPNIFTILILL